MLDVRPLSYVSPLAEQEIGPLTPVIRVQSFADEDCIVTGLVRVYRESLGTLYYHSVLATTPLAAGATADIAALTPLDPGAPADDDYFCIAEITATSTTTGTVNVVPLGQMYFDVKPAPMGPVPATHHTTHEDGGMDEVSVEGLHGVLADTQPVAGHAAEHGFGGGDLLLAENLPTSEMNDTLVLKPNAAGGVHWQAGAGGITDHSDLNQLDYASAGHTGFQPAGSYEPANANIQSHVTGTGAPHTPAGIGAEDPANKGIAGGYCGLPNPLNPSLPLRADGTAARPIGCFYEDDMIGNASAIAPWTLAAIATGTFGTLAGTANHPGIIYFISSTSANSGRSLVSYANGILITGGEITDFCIYTLILEGTTIRLGFHDASGSSDAVDGCYIEMAQVAGVNGIIVGKTAINASRSTTGTNYTLVTNTWYRLRIAVNATATLVTYTLFSEAGATLWTDTLNTNIPTTSGHETGHGIVATNSGTSAVALVGIDYINLWIARALVR